MYRLTVNGRLVETEKEQLLLDFLRDELRLTSVKNGCGEGACGACTVLVDGKKQRACQYTTAKADNRTITTVEGLSPRERDVYAYCFAEAGAVQCGFCIPGMVISAKALLNVNLTPTRADVKKAIRGNICRCTGYKKIEDAILMAADYLRENRPVPVAPDDGPLGRSLHRIDAVGKVLGTGKFTDDLVLPGMIYAKALRSRYPRARVLAVDVSRAEKHPDVVRVLTAKDVPFNKTGHLIPDWDVMIAEGECTRYIGDAIALVATRRKETLDEALNLIDVTYEELTPVTTPAEGLAEGAPRLHENGNLLTRQQLKRGDADKAIAEAAFVVTQHYSTPMTDHAFMEPECAVAEPDGNGGVILYTGSQSVYDEQREVARMLQLPPEKVRSVSSLVGGGFG
ncbi:MAG: 2Fe-2S iron-sulfur cluster-binding protein, partial [Eubacteriales bacterium]|nr:2Fe-2S iron-sulfur cluster-binding protein [Eubacteriales bacterium]